MGSGSALPLLADAIVRHRLLLAALLAGPPGATALGALTRASGTTVVASVDARSLLFSLLIAPLVEELFFRSGVQTALAHWTPMRQRLAAGVDGANLATSLLFAGCHAFNRPLWLAVAVLLPSLLLGCVKQRYESVQPCIALHAWFNACFLWIFAQ